MNSAIHDGFDLGWKMGWVLRGWADPALLDSYERERRPVVEHNVVRSADPNGSHRDVGRELHIDLGERIEHVWLPGSTGLVSTLDLIGPGFTLFTGPEGDAWGTPPRSSATRRRSSCAVSTWQAHARWASVSAVRCWRGPTAYRPHGGRAAPIASALCAPRSGPARAGRCHSPSSQRHDTCPGSGDAIRVPDPGVSPPGVALADRPGTALSWFGSIPTEMLERRIDVLSVTLEHRSVHRLPR